MSKASVLQSDDVAALDRRMAEHFLTGHWQTVAEREEEPKPWLWRWSVIYSCLQEAGEVVPLGKVDDPNNRRTVQLRNPALARGATRTIGMSVQLVNPGETAECHRHTNAALRFVIESKGMYTTVEGERLLMEPGDLLLTPNWTWHDHANVTDSPAIWLDVLDGRLTRYLSASFHEVYSEGRTQPVTKPEGYSKHRLSSIRPRTTVNGNQAFPFVYKWAETRQTLEKLAEAGDASPYDGILLEYTNPVTGGPTMPTIGCWIQMLRPGEETRKHRHTGSSIFHVVQGEGIVFAGKREMEKFEWGERDCFVVPSWCWHQFRNLSNTKPAIIFSVTDRPVLEALGLYREENG
ncbi:MAG TPA: cupin domain-containing protein [Candidatus Acidoferrales bacterium]|nr:cupin domain-containing protein [Candidatus Acidoferrales bacterium]